MRRSFNLIGLLVFGDGWNFTTTQFSAGCGCGENARLCRDVGRWSWCQRDGGGTPRSRTAFQIHFGWQFLFRHRMLIRLESHSLLTLYYRRGHRLVGTLSVFSTISDVWFRHFRSLPIRNNCHSPLFFIWFLLCPSNNGRRGLKTK